PGEEVHGLYRSGGARQVPVPKVIPEDGLFVIELEYHGNERGLLKILENDELTDAGRRRVLRVLVDQSIGARAVIYLIGCLEADRRGGIVPGGIPQIARL